MLCSLLTQVGFTYTDVVLRLLFWLLVVFGISGYVAVAYKVGSLLLRETKEGWGYLPLFETSVMIIASVVWPFSIGAAALWAGARKLSGKEV